MMGRLAEKSVFLRERLKDPERQIEDLRINVDDVTDKLAENIRHGFDTRKNHLENLTGLLKLMNPSVKITTDLLKLDSLRKNVIAEFQRPVDDFKHKLQKNMAMLDILSPLAVLGRGYGIVRKLPDGTIVKNVSSITVGKRINVRVSSGTFDAEVTKISREKKDERKKV
jgi:exodeoxyribonuclease VII large subunit